MSEARLRPTSAELCICFTGQLSLGIRRKHCYCFPSEPPSSSRLPTIVSTSDCQVRLPWSRGNNPAASALSIPQPTCPGGFQRGSKHFQSAADPWEGTAKAKLAPAPPGYVQSLPSQWVKDSAGTAGAMSSHNNLISSSIPQKRDVQPYARVRLV